MRILAHETAGAARTRSSLRPLFIDGAKGFVKLGRVCAARVWSFVELSLPSAQHPCSALAGFQDCRADFVQTPTGARKATQSADTQHVTATALQSRQHSGVLA
jgi:hypothetical protein